MLNRNSRVLILLMAVFCTSAAFSQDIEQDWNEFLHYSKIGRLELAKGFAERILAEDPDPVKLLELSQENPAGYAIVQRMNEKANDEELVKVSSQILDLIEQGRFLKRRDPKIIIEEIKRLSSTERGRMQAMSRLQDAGEFAVMYMIDALSDASRKDEFTNIVWALPKIGRQAIRPCAAALETSNTAVKAEVVKALGEIGYPQAMPYLKYVMEQSKSEELRQLAQQGIRKIDPAGLSIPAAVLFYNLAEDYYYHVESLAPAEDAPMANMWFWDEQDGRLMRQEVDKAYFYELMAMRSCEWALRADASFGKSIGLWLASFFKAESNEIAMPAYFGENHAAAIVYAETAGSEYLHQALDRALRNKNAYVALGTVEALGQIAGQRAMLYRIGPAQPLIEALTFDDERVRYSAAIAIGATDPVDPFAQQKTVVRNLTEALALFDSEDGQLENPWSQKDYPLRSLETMLLLTRCNNSVVDLRDAIETLVDVTQTGDGLMKVMAAEVLAAFNDVDAQRAIAAMALDGENTLDIRIAAFESLALSAKRNSNMLQGETIDAIYDIISSPTPEEELKSAASTAYGSLNLPSQKVKELILDQAKI